MIIFIDGYQNCGKTTLIEKCKYKHNRFPFNQYLNKFNLYTKNELNGFQFGKDLGMLFGLQYVNENIIFDRGPLSSVYYSLKENRYGESTHKIIFDFLKEISQYNNIKFVFIKKINDKQNIKRLHNDGFDYLNDDHDLEREYTFDEMNYLAKSAGIKINTFINDYSKPLNENQIEFDRLLEELINEHN